MLDNKQKLMIGGAVVVFLIIVVAMVMRSATWRQSQSTCCFAFVTVNTSLKPFIICVKV